MSKLLPLTFRLSAVLTFKIESSGRKENKFRRITPSRHIIRHRWPEGWITYSLRLTPGLAGEAKKKKRFRLVNDECDSKPAFFFFPDWSWPQECKMPTISPRARLSRTVLQPLLMFTSPAAKQGGRHWFALIRASSVSPRYLVTGWLDMEQTCTTDTVYTVLPLIKLPKSGANVKDTSSYWNSTKGLCTQCLKTGFVDVDQTCNTDTTNEALHLIKVSRSGQKISHLVTLIVWVQNYMQGTGLQTRTRVRSGKVCLKFQHFLYKVRRCGERIFFFF